jgi:hypothetical protein
VTSIEKDEWRTFKRVLPRDVHEELKRFEELVAQYSGLPPKFEGIGASVSVWSIICEHIRNTQEDLVHLAMDWKRDSGTQR